MNAIPPTSVSFQIEKGCSVNDAAALLGEQFAHVDHKRLTNCGRFGIRNTSGELKGIICIDPPENATAYLWMMCVAEDFRRQGAGTFLLQEAEIWAKCQGCSLLRVKTYQRWQGMRELLKSSGWTISKAELSDRNDGVGEIWVKPLPAKARKIAIVGANPKGRGGEWICRISDAPEYWIPAAIVDSQPATKEFWENKGLPAFASLAEIPDDLGIEAVVLAVPPSATFAIQKDAVSRGLAVLVEKPLAANLHEAAALAELYSVNSHPVVVGVQRRSHPSYVAMQALLSGQELKELSITITLGKAPGSVAGGHRNNSALCRGGALIDLGYHALDLAHFITSAPLRPVSCFLSNLGDLSNGMESYASLLGRAGAVWVRIEVDRHGDKKSETVRAVTSGGVWQADRQGVIAPDGSYSYSCDGTWDMAECGRLSELAARCGGMTSAEDFWEHLAVFEIIEEAYSLAARSGLGGGF